MKNFMRINNAKNVQIQVLVTADPVPITPLTATNVLMTWAKNQIAKSKYVKAMGVKLIIMNNGMKTNILVTHVNIMNTTQNKRYMIILAMKLQVSMQKQYVIDVNRKVIVKWGIIVQVILLKKYISVLTQNFQEIRASIKPINVLIQCNLVVLNS